MHLWCNHRETAAWRMFDFVYLKWRLGLLQWRSVIGRDRIRLIAPARACPKYGQCRSACWCPRPPCSRTRMGCTSHRHVVFCGPEWQNSSFSGFGLGKRVPCVWIRVKMLFSSLFSWNLCCWLNMLFLTTRNRRKWCSAWCGQNQRLDGLRVCLASSTYHKDCNNHQNDYEYGCDDGNDNAQLIVVCLAAAAVGRAITQLR